MLELENIDRRKRCQLSSVAVYHTERPPLCAACLPWCSMSRGFVSNSRYLCYTPEDSLFDAPRGLRVTCGVLPQGWIKFPKVLSDGGQNFNCITWQPQEMLRIRFWQLLPTVPQKNKAVKTTFWVMQKFILQKSHRHTYCIRTLLSLCQSVSWPLNQWKV